MNRRFEEKYQDVRELAHGDLDNPAKTTLYDWMKDGLWEEVSAEEIASEWNELEALEEEEAGLEEARLADLFP